MATIELQVDDGTKAELDSLFSGLGLDTPTAIKMFFDEALEQNGMPFAAKRSGKLKPNAELREAMEDVRLRRNLHGPFATVEDAMRSMLED
jgi:DNA-damage-inducible protein J